MKRTFKNGDTVVFEPASSFDATYYRLYGITKGMTGRVTTVRHFWHGFKGHSIWADPLHKLLFVAWYAADGQTISIGTAVESVRKAAGGKGKASRRGMKQNMGRSSRRNPTSKIASAQAKKIIKGELDRLGLPYTKISARTIGFSDLARDSMVFVRIGGWNASPMAAGLERLARDHGFRVEFAGHFGLNPLKRDAIPLNHAVRKSVKPRRGTPSRPTTNPAAMLTQAQIDEVKAEMLPYSQQTGAVRFMRDGNTYNIVTGEAMPASANNMYKVYYWGFTRATALKIAKWLNMKAVFSE